MNRAHLKWAAMVSGLALLAVAPLGQSAQPAKKPPAQTSATPAPEDDVETERENADKLRRAIQKSEAERNARERQRNTQAARQANISRLQTTIGSLQRDESMLQSQVRDTETRLLYNRPDPTDMSAYSRRSELESQLSYARSQLQQKSTERRITERQLNELRLR